MSEAPKISPNFSFLPARYSILIQIATAAERYLALGDPNTALIKLRQFGEILIKQVAAQTGHLVHDDESQVELLRRLGQVGLLQESVLKAFHGLRVEGNHAVHQGTGTDREALHQLKIAHKLAAWVMKALHGQQAFDPGPYLPPRAPQQASEAFKEEIQHLQAVLASKSAETAAERERRAQAEALAQKYAEETAAVLELAEAVEAEAAESRERQEVMAAQLAELQAEAQAQSQPQLQEIQDTVRETSADLSLDEADTRYLIDKQLRATGWEADTQEIRHSRGVRPQKGKNLAIAEWPTKFGPADYALFIGLEIVGFVEAKRDSRNVSAVIEQAKRYSRGYQQKGDDVPPQSGPWGEYKVPFLFSTNGRPFLRQLLTGSGIWFLDARRPQNISRPLESWYSPEGLKAELAKDVDSAHEQLRSEPTEYLGLRPYQIKAIEAVEQALEQGQREMLVAMATGTGKTRTCIGMVYRLIKTKRLRRVLFLVDRSALGEQAANAFKDVRLEGLQTFNQIFDIKEMTDQEPDLDTRLHISTIQAMVRRVLLADDEADIPSVDTYDGIVVDECHRGYLLDRELGCGELEFRDQGDYISKYRRVLDHFDAVKIGLTATPALHTTEIFGPPICQYSYREAVIDGFLVDHEPPIRIITKLAEDGISWRAGETVETYTPQTGQLDLITLPDDVSMEVDQFNTEVQTENFNKVVCKELTRYIDPSLDEKTIIFCATDAHADMVVYNLKHAFKQAHGEVEDSAIVKITGSADKPLQLIRRFKNERLPSIVVTVDLMTTGIDVPPVSNLVFIRRVRSRILFEQMMGRATRLCPAIHKESFRIFDAVDLYRAIQNYTDMKPVVVNPSFTFQRLVDELANTNSDQARTMIVEQFLAKLQRKKNKIRDQNLEAFESAASMRPDALVQMLRSQTIDQTSDWLLKHRELASLLDRMVGPFKPQYISTHEDKLERVERGYGDASEPEDYLEGFKTFLQENMNSIPALTVVTQRPREMTRQQLKELKLSLDQAGYNEKTLQTAWREMTNQDIAASIIGFIRQQALGEPLMSYKDRVDRALKKILASQRWTPPQRQWLDRIGKQMLVETVVDRTALDRGQFKSQGGFNRINKVFEGKLETVLVELHEELWKALG